MKRYSDEWWQGVKDFNNSFPISIFKKDKEMTANELADKCNRLQGEIILGFLADCATMLRQQQAEIKALRLRELTYEEISDIRDKHLAPKDCNIYTFARAILQKASEK